MTHAWATIIPTRVEYLDCIVFGKRKPFTRLPVGKLRRFDVYFNVTHLP